MPKGFTVKIEDVMLIHTFSIKDPVNEDELGFKLTTDNYKINKERLISRPPLEVNVLNFARKNDIHILYDQKSIPSYIGVKHKKPDVALLEFEKLGGYLHEIDPSILDQVTNTNCTVTSKCFLDGKKYADFSELFKGVDMTVFSKINPNFRLDTLKIQTKKSNSDDDICAVSISPYYTDQRYIFLQTRIITHELTKIAIYLNSHETYIKQVVEAFTNA